MFNQQQSEQVKEKLMINKQDHIDRVFKIVAISDTHASFNQMEKMVQTKQKGDFFIHCGDFTRYGRQEHFQKFIDCLKNINFKHKIVIAGNHQISLDSNMPIHKRQKLLDKYPCKYNRQQILGELKMHCHYLEHQFLQIQGIKIFGSPYTIKYGNGAFQYSRQDDEKVWGGLPQLDILITHSPPYGILDKTNHQKHGGSPALYKQMMNIKPKLHLFGHIHEARGDHKIGKIQLYNVAKQAVTIKFKK